MTELFAQNQGLARSGTRANPLHVTRGRVRAQGECKAQWGVSRSVACQPDHAFSWVRQRHPAALLLINTIQDNDQWRLNLALWVRTRLAVLVDEGCDPYEAVGVSLEELFDLMNAEIGKGVSRE